MTAHGWPEAESDHPLRPFLSRAEQNLRQDGCLCPIVVIEGRVANAILDVGAVWGPTRAERAQLLYRLGGMLGFGLDASRAIAVFDGFCRIDAADDLRPLPDSGSLLDDAQAQDAIFVVEMLRDGGSALLEMYDKIVHLQEGTTFVFEPAISGTGFATSGTFTEFWRGLREVEGLMRLGADRYGETLDRARELVAKQFERLYPGLREVT